MQIVDPPENFEFDVEHIIDDFVSFSLLTEIRDKKLQRIISELLESEADKQDPEGFEVSGMDIKDLEVGNAPKYSDIQGMLTNMKELHEELKKCIRKRSDIFRDGNMGRDKVHNCFTF
ncbi:hypothetical protein BVRB_5g126470 [Beta vulgaris subsp. vulgaris]|uniref:Uncharacterized protein n=1 Tax=Beta vulgaris subsp. vulgaris TaxID=3555 RepID=A0A0J8BBW7_BETVV|nr:hypothetical protein BVRB_5g126470 [Beta vulgaris subsp. vulgaris]